MERGVLASAANGATVASVDGPELLIWNGTDLQPRWRLFLDAPLVGVVCQVGRVVALDAAGRLTLHRDLDGRLESEVALGEAGVALAGSADGWLAAALPSQVLVLPPGASGRSLSLRGVKELAFGEGHRTLGTGGQDGLFRVHEVESGRLVGQIAVGGPVVGVAWSSRGRWLVSAGGSLVLVRPDALALEGTLLSPGVAVGATAASEDGVAVGLAVSTQQVLIGELHQNRPLGALHFRRPIEALTFGPGQRLLAALDDAELCEVDLVTGATRRSEPHQGRGRAAFAVDLQVDLAGLRGATALARAQGAPLATYTGWKPPEGPSWWAWGMGLFAGCLVLLLGSAFLVALTSFVLYLRGFR